MVCERREASACLIMLSAKQGSHWYHFYNVFGMTRPGIDPTPILSYRTRSGRSASWAIAAVEQYMCMKSCWSGSYDIKSPADPDTVLCNIMVTLVLLILHPVLIRIHCYIPSCCSGPSGIKSPAYQEPVSHEVLQGDRVPSKIIVKSI